MFPTLFPNGRGGFDDDSRPVPIGFRLQAEYYLDLADHHFRSHRCFMFHTLNVHQHRLSHLHSALTVRKGCFNSIAPILASLDPKTIETVAKHIENEGKISDLTSEGQNVMTLLWEVNTVSAKIPGSSASKSQLRNEIRAYVGYFGLPHLYLTMNPAAGHSLVFQAMWGDDAVNLAECFPDLAPSHERAIRLTSDPVAGADFFTFMIEKFFSQLLGWDYSTQRSSADGGIFGHIRAYYGTAEFTERGQLHGHFLIWLDGDLNPSDVHARMKANPEWQQQFFDFFEDIIKHHLPDTDDELLPDQELRSERPPHLDNTDFEHEFNADVKLLGEQVQRHDNPCRKNVCFKYGSTECRFGYPHDIIEKSYFDESANAVILKCLDPLINYHNPTILAFCRHNHDLKCILSGKSVKAAMFYISDYITKNDEKMHQVLSMLCSAVAAVLPQGSEKTSTEHAHTLLHKCLAARIRAQNIHAQQAAMYLRGSSDGMCTHTTIPMLSSAVIAFLAKSLVHSVQLQDDCTAAGETKSKEDDCSDHGDVPISDEDDIKGAEIHIRVDANGKLYECNQVDDYLHRDDLLAALCFYDFVRCYRKEKKGQLSGQGRLRRFILKSAHREAHTHILVEFADPTVLRPGCERIPHVVGRSIPRRCQDESYYAIFMLAHFAPYSQSKPLSVAESSIAAMFDTTTFSERSITVMKNWEAVHECEDEREAERLKKRSAKLNQTKMQVHAVEAMIPDEYLNDPEAYRISEFDFAHEQIDNHTLHMRCSLLNANWTRPHRVDPIDPLHQYVDNLHAPINLRQWKVHIKAQETAVGNARRAQLDPTQQTSGQTVHETSGGVLMQNLSKVSQNKILDTKTPSLTNDTKALKWDEVLKSIEIEYMLNFKQSVAFRIAAQKFGDILSGFPNSTKPLCMLMTGPGGTGKTHVVKALKELMARYNCAHHIRFLAPTGAAAALIGGQTIHTGLGLKIQSRHKGDKQQPDDDL